MNRIKLIYIFSCLLTICSTEVFSYCIQHENDRAHYDSGPIPVYVQTYGSTGIREIGLQTDDGEDSNNYEIEVRWIRAAIEIINSASTGAPPLYYAGINNGLGYNYSFSDLDPGITIASWICQSQPTDSIAVQTSSSNKSLIRFNRGGSQSCSNSCDWENNPGTNTCNAWYVGPDQRTTLGAKNDFLGVLVHELVHSLGLGHSNQDEATWNSHCSNPYQGDVSASVMNTDYKKDWRHTLRRDDIEGLREIYGKPERIIYTQNLDTEFVSRTRREGWSGTERLGDYMITNTPAALSYAATNTFDEILGGFTYYYNDRFRYFTGDWDSWNTGYYSSGYNVLSDLSDSIRSFQKVSVAAGEPEIGFSSTRRQLFAWVGGVNTATEMTSDEQVRIRWRVKIGTTWLSSGSTLKTHYTNFSSAYDPGTDRFIIAYIDNSGSNNAENQYLHIQTINAWNGQASCTTVIDDLPDLHPYEIGDMSCDFKADNVATSCVIPVSNLSNDGPKLQFVQGKIGPLANPNQQVNTMCFNLETNNPWFELGQNTFSPTPIKSFGHMGGAMRGYDLIGASYPGGPITFTYPGYSDILVSHKDEFNVDGSYHTFVIQRNGSGLTNSISLEDDLLTNYWPLRFGGMSSANNSVNRARWKAITYEKSRLVVFPF